MGRVQGKSTLLECKKNPCIFDSLFIYSLIYSLVNYIKQYLLNGYYVQVHLYRGQERQNPSSNEEDMLMGEIISKQRNNMI